MYYRTSINEYNECSGRGMCSIAPNISSFQEVMMTILRVTAYYIIKLETLGINCSNDKDKIIYSLSNLISNTIYSDEQLLELIVTNYNNLIRLKRKYTSKSKSNGFETRYIKLPLKLTENMGLSDILSTGERILYAKNNKMSNMQKCYSEILFVVIKSVALSIVKLSDYDTEIETAKDILINSLNIFNSGRNTLSKLKKHITELTSEDLKLWISRKKAQQSTYGKISETKVSLSTKPGKAILVSGSSLKDLYKLLINTENENIDVYTHGDLIIAHSFEKFKKFRHLKGNFGSSNESCIIDFATFPGPILLTRHSAQNLEYLIRGRIYTTELIAPKGVTLINRNDFSPLIKAAYNSKGFTHGKVLPPITIGYNTSEIENKFEQLRINISTKKIKHLLLLGMSNYSSEQAQYFNELLENITDEVFVISFSFGNNLKNIMHLDIANNFPQQLAILEMLFEKIPVTSENITFFLTKCDANALSIMISLKQQGAKRIYLSSCPPTIINPSVLNSFMQEYKINAMTIAKEDLKKII